MNGGNALSRVARRVRDGGDSDDSLPVGLTLLSGAIAALLLSPVAWILLRAFEIPGDRTLELLFAQSSVEVLINTVLLVVFVTVGSILLGVPLAVLTVQTDFPFRRAWTVLFALPLVIPSYIGAFAYVSAFGPRGALADLLAPIGIDSLPQLYGLEGTAIVLTLYIYPYVFITTRAALLSFDSTLIEVARSLNQDRLSAFRRVTLPQITPGISAGALLVALYALSDFGTPAIMHYDVFTRMIFVEYNTFGRDVAALLSIQLLSVTAVILALEARIGGADRTGYFSRDSRSSERIMLGRWLVPALCLAVLVVLFTLALPLGVLLMWVLRTGPGYEAGGFVFEWAIGLNSAYVSGLAALVAVAAALPIAYLAARSDTRLARLIERTTYVGYAIPGVVLGLSLIYFGVRFAPAIYQGIPLLIFAYVVRFLPQAVGTTRSSVLQVDEKLTEAARSLGHDTLSAFRRITIPLIAPGVVAGAALVFLTTMKELPATLLLRPAGFDTLVTFIWRVQDAGYYGQAAVPAIVLVVISGLSMLVLLTRE